MMKEPIRTLAELRKTTDNELSAALRYWLYEQGASASNLHYEQAQRQIDRINKILNERFPERAH